MPRFLFFAAVAAEYFNQKLGERRLLVTAGHSKKLMIDMSGPKEGDNNNDNDDEKRLSDHTAPPC